MFVLLAHKITVFEFVPVRDFEDLLCGLKVNQSFLIICGRASVSVSKKI